MIHPDQMELHTVQFFFWVLPEVFTKLQNVDYPVQTLKSETSVKLRSLYSCTVLTFEIGDGSGIKFWARYL